MARRLGNGIKGAAEGIAFVLRLARDGYPVLWCVVPELGAAVVAAALCVLGDRLDGPPVEALRLGGIPLAFCVVAFAPLLRLPFAALMAAMARASRSVPDPVDNLIVLA